MRLVFLLMLLFSSPALAEPEIRPQEQVRLDGFDAAIGPVLLNAFAQGALGDVDMLQSALAGAPLAPLQTNLGGAWKCRTIRLGGDVPLVVYAQFDCEITPDGTTFHFEKLSGSQRSSGTILLIDRRMIYLGVGYADGVHPLPYGALPGGDFGSTMVQPQVGIVEQVNPDMVRIMFPAPVVGAQLEILLLTR